MTSYKALAFPAHPINHLARPGTEGVIKPKSFIYDGDLDLFLLPDPWHIQDLNFRKIRPSITLMTTDLDVLCFREEKEINIITDRRSIEFSSYINQIPHTRIITDINDSDWRSFIVNAALEHLLTEVNLKSVDHYRGQLNQAFKDGKVRYLCLSDSLYEQSHLGIHFVLHVNPIDLDFNMDILKNRRWANMKTLYEMHYNSDILLNPWSLAVADHYLTGNRY